VCALSPVHQSISPVHQRTPKTVDLHARYLLPLLLCAERITRLRDQAHVSRPLHELLDAQTMELSLTLLVLCLGRRFDSNSHGDISNWQSASPDEPVGASDEQGDPSAVVPRAITSAPDCVSQWRQDGACVILSVPCVCVGGARSVTIYCGQSHNTDTRLSARISGTDGLLRLWDYFVFRDSRNFHEAFPSRVQSVPNPT
jgi:hypothetical protein